MSPPPDLPYLRTSADRFHHLPDFPYKPHYLEYGNLRMAYIDETVGDGSETFLCLHGQPTWSYLYRKMIPVFLKYTTLSPGLSRRVIAPDLLGFGRSDKPTQDAAYTFNFHRDALLHFIKTRESNQYHTGSSRLGWFAGLNATNRRSLAVQTSPHYEHDLGYWL
jgi:haloalkane dehalogenase